MSISSLRKVPLDFQFQNYTENLSESSPHARIVVSRIRMIIVAIRFGRDYYINQSKLAKGERSERARSAMSSSSRPSSSLSQRSSCAGDEQRSGERQVSHELERFEAVSLHSSLPRRCCSDLRTSPHFAINPLLHLEVARSSVSDESATTTTTTTSSEEKNVVDHGMGVEEPITPRYNPDNNREGSPGDRDSGMFSTGSLDSEIGSERDYWRRLCRLENADQISSVGGRKFWITAHKYHTFGGIRLQSQRPDLGEDPEDLDDLDDESVSDDAIARADHAPELVRFKFQTFGGIRRSRRFDGKRTRLKLRTPLKAAGKGQDSSRRTWPEESVDEEKRCSTSSAFEESDWQDQETDVVNPAEIDGFGSVGENNVFRMRRRSAARRKKATPSSLPSVAGKIIMDKFLRDVSRRRKAGAFSDNVATSRRRKSASRGRREVPGEDVDGGLEKSASKKNSSESWKSSQRERKNGSKRRRDEMSVRSLSEVTIW